MCCKHRYTSGQRHCGTARGEKRKARKSGVVNQQVDETGPLLRHDLSGNVVVANWGESVKMMILFIHGTHSAVKHSASCSGLSSGTNHKCGHNKHGGRSESLRTNRRNLRHWGYVQHV